MNRILFSFLASALSVAAFAVELDLAGEWSLIAVKDVQTGTYAKTDKPDVSPYIPAMSTTDRTRQTLCGWASATGFSVVRWR